MRVPIGVVAAYLAWNYPLLNLGFKLGPALAAGCSLIIRPSVETPLSAYMLGEVCAEIGFPAGVVTVICGPHDSVGGTIVRSPITAGVTLIGSTPTGVNLIRESATSIKRYSMELGGNAPVLIFDDADLDKAVDTVADLKFGNTGQICVAPNRMNRMTRELQFGEVQVNGFKYNIDLPHIGIKQSGIGCDCSHWALDDYQAMKRITLALS